MYLKKKVFYFHTHIPVGCLSNIDPQKLVYIYFYNANFLLTVSVPHNKKDVS